MLRAPLVCRAARCTRGWRPAREPSAPRVDVCCPAGVPGAGRASTETAIAFAGAKWVFLARFSAALVMVVSMVAVQGRAVVLLVSTLPRCRASCAKKFALHAYIGPNLACSGVLGDFFRGRAAGGAVLGEFFRANRPCAGLGCSAVHFRLAADGGFAALGTGCRRVAGVSHP